MEVFREIYYTAMLCELVLGHYNSIIVSVNSAELKKQADIFSNLYQIEFNSKNKIIETIKNFEKTISEYDFRIFSILGVLIAVFSIIGFNFFSNAAENRTIGELLMLNIALICVMAALFSMIVLVIDRNDLKKSGKTFCKFTCIVIAGIIGIVILYGIYMLIVANC